MKLKESLKPKVYRLIEAFEGSGGGAAAGNFDGQLLSWGALHWNLGSGTLQPLLLEIMDRTDLHLAPFEQLREGRTPTLSWLQANGVLDNRGNVTSEWQTRFREYYNHPVVQEIMVRHAEPYFHRAWRLAVAFGFQTERAFALCMDICVQNGSVDPVDFNSYLSFLAAFEPKDEWERLKALGYGMAEGSNPQWSNDVRLRKNAIAVGQGAVHGRHYNMAEDFGIRYYTDDSRETLALWHQED